MFSKELQLTTFRENLNSTYLLSGLKRRQFPEYLDIID